MRTEKGGAFGAVWREKKARFRVLGSVRKMKRDDEDEIGIVANFRDWNVAPLKRHCNAMPFTSALSLLAFYNTRPSIFSLFLSEVIFSTPANYFLKKRK